VPRGSPRQLQKGATLGTTTSFSFDATRTAFDDFEDFDDFDDFD
jgi:hypothetical protein